MDLGILVLGLVGLAVVLAFIHVAGKMASEREVAARRKQVGNLPFSGDTITYSGHS
jgi:hypothetical protein